MFETQATRQVLQIADLRVLSWVAPRCVMPAPDQDAPLQHLDRPDGSPFSLKFTLRQSSSVSDQCGMSSRTTRAPNSHLEGSFRSICNQDSSAPRPTRHLASQFLGLANYGSPLAFEDQRPTK